MTTREFFRDSRRASPKTRRARSGARTLARAVVLLLLLGGQAFGNDVLRSVQQELRARKLYFGPIDGRQSATSTAAIRRLQELKGIDQSGQLDSDTLRSLGIQAAPSDPLAEKGCAVVQQYLAARMGDDMNREMRLFADTVNYFDDGEVERAFVRAEHLRENERWPRRRYTLINRIATANPTRNGEVIVTARIRTEVSNPTRQPPALTEDVAFTLRETRGGLRIVSLKRIE